MYAVFPWITRVRKAMQVSILPREVDVTHGPGIGPAFWGSTSSMICMARTLGAPETVPAGSPARRASKAVLPACKPAGHVRRDVHDVRIALDLHHVAELDGAIIGDAAHVVASQVDEHDMLGSLLGVGQQLFGQRAVLGLVAPRRRVPASGRIVTVPSSTRTRISGELPINAKSPYGR